MAITPIPRIVRREWIGTGEERLITDDGRTWRPTHGLTHDGETRREIGDRLITIISKGW